MSLQSGNFYKTIQSVQSNITALQSSGSTIRSDISGVILKFEDLSGQVVILDASMSEVFSELENLDSSLNVASQTPSKVLLQESLSFSFTRPTLVATTFSQSLPKGTYLYSGNLKLTIGLNTWNSSTYGFITSFEFGVLNGQTFNTGHRTRLGNPRTFRSTSNFINLNVSGSFVITNATSIPRAVLVIQGPQSALIMSAVADLNVFQMN